MSPDTPQGEGGWQVRRVLWAGREVMRGDRATIATCSRNTARQGLLSGGRRGAQLLRATGAPTSRSSPSAITSRRKRGLVIPEQGDIDYSVELELNLADVKPRVAGEASAKNLIELPKLKKHVVEAVLEALTEKRINKPRGAGIGQGVRTIRIETTVEHRSGVCGTDRVSAS